MQSMSHDTLYSLLHITKGFIGRGRGANVSGLGPWVWCVWGLGLSGLRCRVWSLMRPNYDISSSRTTLIQLLGSQTNNRQNHSE